MFNLNLSDFSNTYVIDPKCGAAIDIWKLLTNECIGKIIWKNDHFDPEFNFQLPNPTSKETLLELGAATREYNCIGIANDPDADRHAMVDETGRFVPPETIAAIIIDYCISENIEIESISTTLANSALVKIIAKKHAIAINETKIGFKYFTDHLKSAFNKNSLAIGVESSGGFSISHHTYDKCGFLPILLILGIMKKKDKSLVELQDQIHRLHGHLLFVEDAITLTPGRAPLVRQHLSRSQQKFAELFSDPIMEINTNDGLKITFENNDWVLCRPSGTEPLIRIYAESSILAKAEYYTQQIRTLIESIGE